MPPSIRRCHTTRAEPLGRWLSHPLRTLGIVRTKARLRVGSDMDAVVYAFDRSCAQLIHRMTGRPLVTMPPATEWDFWAEWGMSTSEFFAFFEAGVRSGWLFRHGPEIPGAIAALKRLGANHDLVFVTNRDVFGQGQLTMESTRFWLAQRGITDPEIVFSADKIGLGLDFHLDDSPEVIAGMQAAGEPVVICSRPWNAHLPGLRAATWGHYEAMVESAARLVTAA